MFTCKYADYITKDKPITFTQVITDIIDRSASVNPGHCGLNVHFFLFCWTETHAILQKENGLGNYEPQVIVMSWVLFRHLKFTHEEGWAPFLMRFNWDLHTSSSDQKPAVSLKTPAPLPPELMLADGCCWSTNHCLPLFFCSFDSRCSSGAS